MPTVLSNKQSPPLNQNIYQNQSKQTKNREAHGDVMQDKRDALRARIRVDQPAAFADTARSRGMNTANPRTKKHSSKRRKLQITTWVDEPLMLKLAAKARKRDLSMSTTVRRLLRKVVAEDDGEVDEALDTEALVQSHTRDTNRLARRLSWLLIWILFDVSHIKAHTTNVLGMQKGMTERMLKDILQDADRQTKTKLSRKNPELTEFVDAIEKWLTADEDARENGGGTNGTRARGGSRL
jgi:hypothetical protein